VPEIACVRRSAGCVSFTYKERFLAPDELSDWAERVGGRVPLYDSNCAKEL